jgi:hypothetical protein
LGNRKNCAREKITARWADLRHEYRLRQAGLRLRFAELAGSRTVDEEKVQEITSLLLHWMVAGKSA